MDLKNITMDDLKQKLNNNIYHLHVDLGKLIFLLPRH